MSRVLIDLKGQTFGRLTVLTRAARNTAQGKPMWLCRCTCGTSCVVAGQGLRNGHTKSCGCLVRENPGRERRPHASYLTAHRRVHADRGRASLYACIECGGAAQDWSYDGTDPNEVSGEWAGGSGRTFIAHYSLKPEFYSPRCKPCHRAFDSNQKEELSWP